MKTIFKHILPAALFALTTVGAAAQNTYSGYFLDNYMYSFEMNPAMVNMGKHGFVSMPALGNVNAGMNGNLHLTDIIYKGSDGKSMLFANPEISAKEALGKFSNKNMLDADVKLDILAVGFKAFGGQNVVSLSANVDGNVMIPKSLFSLIKEGVSNQTYDIRNVRANATAYATLQFNHQRDLSKWVPGLKAGAALKFNFGMAMLDAYFREAQLQLGENAWIAKTNADIYASIGSAAFKKDYNKHTHREYVNGIDMDGFGVNGFGIAFDLGATYKWRDFNFSLAMTDLGFISWSKTQYATTDGVKQVDTDAFIFGVEGDDAKNTWYDMRDQLSYLYQLDDKGNIGNRTRGLRAKLNWGVEYELPYYRRLTFGMVNHTTFNGPFTDTQFRFSANVRPVDCLSASANFVAGTYGVGFGWLLNVNVTGFNLFLGMDHTMGKLCKQGIPLHSNAEVNLGINFPF